MTGLGSSCGACKFLRRKCTTECVFAPYFSYEQAASHFSAVHKVFGASNVSKLLLQLPVQCRSDAAITISFEALARMQDPVYGCVAHIFELQQQIVGLQEEIEILGHQMANFTVGITTDGDLNYGDAMNSQCYQSQLGAQLSSGYTPENQAFNDQMVLQQEHSFEFEDQSLCCDFQANPLGILVQGVDQDFLPYCPLLGSANNAN